MRWLVLVFLMAAVMVLVAWWPVEDQAGDGVNTENKPRLELSSPPRELGEEKWKEATKAREWRFPEDHASHPDYRTEWWYYTGHCESQDGKQFGFQLTFFRIGLVSEPKLSSAWAVRDVHMAHFAVSDFLNKTYVHDDLFSRGGPGMAGAKQEKYEVWNGPWSVTLNQKGEHVLKATSASAGIDFVIRPKKKVVLHGKVGLSQKGKNEGNASYYYSLPRSDLTGALTVQGKTYQVKGLAWMDHEFGSTFLEEDKVGWDWFSLQFADGRELMIYRFRRQDQGRDFYSSGTWIDASGKVEHLSFDEFTLSPSNYWTSSKTGGRYPLRWKIEIPKYELDLEVAPPLKNQEFVSGRKSGVSYWEGAVRAKGKVAGKAVTGQGYLEMTGYAGEPIGKKFQ